MLQQLDFSLSISFLVLAFPLILVLEMIFVARIYDIYAHIYTRF